jgi:hypothetical protein
MEIRGQARRGLRRDPVATPASIARSPRLSGGKFAFAASHPFVFPRCIIVCPRAQRSLRRTRCSRRQPPMRIARPPHCAQAEGRPNAVRTCRRLPTVSVRQARRIWLTNGAFRISTQRATYDAFFVQGFNAARPVVADRLVAAARARDARRGVRPSMVRRDEAARSPVSRRHREWLAMAPMRSGSPAPRRRRQCIHQDRAENRS